MFINLFMAVRCLHWQTLRHLVFTRPKQIKNLWINCPARKFMYVNKCLVLKFHQNIRFGELPYDTSLLVGVSQHQRPDFHVSTTYSVYAGVWNRTSWIEITVYGLSSTVYGFRVRFEKKTFASEVFEFLHQKSSLWYQSTHLLYSTIESQGTSTAKRKTEKIFTISSLKALLLENEQVYSD